MILQEHPFEAFAQIPYYSFLIILLQYFYYQSIVPRKKTKVSCPRLISPKIYFIPRGSYAGM